MHVLYICPDGIMDDLGQTQVLSYIFGLNKKGYKFIIFSFERSDRRKEEFLRQKFILNEKNIKWYYLPFYPAKFHRILRLFFGVIKLIIINQRNRIDFIHIRSINAGIIYLFSGINKKYLYDIRSFAGQIGDYGLINKSSWLINILTKLEKKLIKNANGIVVLDKSGSDYIKENFTLKVPCEIIPTSTKTFNLDKLKREKLFNKKVIKFVFLGGARFPYLPKKALEFIKLLIKNKIDSRIDIINQRHHKYIEEDIKEINFPRDKIKIFPLKPSEIKNNLVNYDCGLVFIESGQWIKMSSPTKIGEYLAAGLHVLGLQGIEVLDRLSKETNSVDVLPRDFESLPGNLNLAYKILHNIKNPNRVEESIKIAQKYYDINKALKSYHNLYKIIEKNKKCF